MDSCFVSRHELWTEQQQGAAEELASRIRRLDLSQVRLSWADQHGTLRGKTLETAHFLKALRHGKDFQTAPLLFDTSGDLVVPLSGASSLGGPRIAGLPNAVLVPDPATFTPLPWLPATGWILGDLYFRSGERVPFDTRGILRAQLDGLAGAGYEYVAGIELEFYITRTRPLRPSGPGPDGALSPFPGPPRPAHGPGTAALSEDELETVVHALRDGIVSLELPLATVEEEWGPGQVELTFEPLAGMTAADTVMLVRSTVRQLCRRHGYHATFMSRPQLDDVVPSGWHLHQSLRNGTQGNCFAGKAGRLLSDTGSWFMGGLLEHANACAVLTTPTLNGYKRYRSGSFAPDRIAWAEENRDVLIRVAGGHEGPHTRLENRVGDPAANPYLYLASQIISGRDGLRTRKDPGPPARTPRPHDARPLPKTLEEALPHFEQSALLRAELGDAFVDYLATIKRHEIDRFHRATTDWEQREYFDAY